MAKNTFLEFASMADLEVPVIKRRCVSVPPMKFSDIVTAVELDISESSEYEEEAVVCRSRWSTKKMSAGTSEEESTGEASSIISESDAEEDMPLCTWKRMCMPEQRFTGAAGPRRWRRLVAKLLTVRRGNLMLTDGARSLGSMGHMVGRPCRPCRFVNTAAGCFDGRHCKFCHMEGGHTVDTALARPKRAKARRSNAARALAEKTSRATRTVTTRTRAAEASWRAPVAHHHHHHHGAHGCGCC